MPLIDEGFNQISTLLQNMRNLTILVLWASTLSMSSSCQFFVSCPSPSNPLLCPIRDILEDGKCMILAPPLHVIWLWWHMTVMSSDCVTWLWMTHDLSSQACSYCHLCVKRPEKFKFTGPQNSILIWENIISDLIIHPNRLSREKENEEFRRNDLQRKIGLREIVCNPYCIC